MGFPLTRPQSTLFPNCPKWAAREDGCPHDGAKQEQKCCRRWRNFKALMMTILNKLVITKSYSWKSTLPTEFSFSPFPRGWFGKSSRLIIENKCVRSSGFLGIHIPDKHMYCSLAHIRPDAYIFLLRLSCGSQIRIVVVPWWYVVPRRAVSVG